MLICFFLFVAALCKIFPRCFLRCRFQLDASHAMKWELLFLSCISLFTEGNWASASMHIIKWNCIGWHERINAGLFTRSPGRQTRTLVGALAWWDYLLATWARSNNKGKSRLLFPQSNTQRVLYVCAAKPDVWQKIKVRLKCGAAAHGLKMQLVSDGGGSI